MAICCGHTLSQRGEKVIRWTWLSMTTMMLLCGIILTSVGHEQGRDDIYAWGILTILISICVFVLWVCYQCNYWGWQDPGCGRCHLGCLECAGACVCCPRSGYGEL